MRRSLLGGTNATATVVDVAYTVTAVGTPTATASAVSALNAMSRTDFASVGASAFTAVKAPEVTFTAPAPPAQAPAPAPVVAESNGGSGSGSNATAIGVGVGVGVGGALLLGGIGFYLYRRKKAAAAAGGGSEHTDEEAARAAKRVRSQQNRSGKEAPQVERVRSKGPRTSQTEAGGDGVARQKSGRRPRPIKTGHEQIDRVRSQPGTARTPAFSPKTSPFSPKSGALQTEESFGEQALSPTTPSKARKKVVKKVVKKVRSKNAEEDGGVSSPNSPPAGGGT